MSLQRRLQTTFAQLKAKDETALIAFVTAGDPTPEDTIEIVTALAESGVDAVEIGVPFSDPLADGPAIQASSQRALDGGMTVFRTLETVREIRKRNPDLPLILMTYYNPILHYGLARYAQDAKAAGADAHIVTDLTPEEAHEWKALSEQNDLDTVFLLAPTSTEVRMKIVSELSSGFLYCVSRTGVTGANQNVSDELAGVVSRIKAHSALPVCVGFGVSEPSHVATISHYADGVIVGSALVNLIHQHKTDDNLLPLVRDFALSLKAATKKG